jgi:hypothetical protein
MIYYYWIYLSFETRHCPCLRLPSSIAASAKPWGA